VLAVSVAIVICLFVLKVADYRKTVEFKNAITSKIFSSQSSLSMLEEFYLPGNHSSMYAAWDRFYIEFCDPDHELIHVDSDAEVNSEIISGVIDVKPDHGFLMAISDSPCTDTMASLTKVSLKQKSKEQVRTASLVKKKAKRFAKTFCLSNNIVDQVDPEGGSAQIKTEIDCNDRLKRNLKDAAVKRQSAKMIPESVECVTSHRTNESLLAGESVEPVQIKMEVDVDVDENSNIGTRETAVIRQSVSRKCKSGTNSLLHLKSPKKSRFAVDRHQAAVWAEMNVINAKGNVEKGGASRWSSRQKDKSVSKKEVQTAALVKKKTRRMAEKFCHSNIVDEVDPERVSAQIKIEIDCNDRPKRIWKDAPLKSLSAKMLPESVEIVTSHRTIESLLAGESVEPVQIKMEVNVDENSNNGTRETTVIRQSVSRKCKSGTNSLLHPKGPKKNSRFAADFHEIAFLADVDLIETKGNACNAAEMYVASRWPARQKGKAVAYSTMNGTKSLNESTNAMSLSTESISLSSSSLKEAKSEKRKTVPTETTPIATILSSAINQSLLFDEHVQPTKVELDADNEQCTSSKDEPVRILSRRQQTNSVKHYIGQKKAQLRRLVVQPVQVNPEVCKLSQRARKRISFQNRSISGQHSESGIDSTQSDTVQSEMEVLVDANYYNHSNVDIDKIRVKSDREINNSSSGRADFSKNSLKSGNYSTEFVEQKDAVVSRRKRPYSLTQPDGSGRMRSTRFVARTSLQVKQEIECEVSGITH